MESSKLYKEVDTKINRMLSGFDDDIKAYDCLQIIEDAIKNRKIKFSEYDELIGKLKVIESITIY